MAARTLTAARVVTPLEVFEPGHVTFDGDRITSVGPGSVPGATDLGAVTIAPGFVDMHVHGGGGGSYTEPNADSVRRARATHLAHGTTTSNASTVAEHPERLLEQVALLADMVEAGVIDGIHLEGPWISVERCGAHDPGALRSPDLAELERVIAAGRGHIRMVTIAPELPGALEAIACLKAHSIVASAGHTDASLDETQAGIDAGITCATHLFNAMRPLHHREPGPITALLADARVTVELIADGVHLHPALASLVADLAPSHRVALVTDAMAAAALGDGDYRLGALDVRVTDAVARVASNNSIAGSTATMDELYRTAVERFGFIAASLQASTNPARVMGWDDVGAIAPGRLADFVMLDTDLSVVDVWKSGVSVAAAEQAGNPS